MKSFSFQVGEIFLLRGRRGKRSPGLKPLCVQAAYIIGLIYRSMQVRRLSSLLNYLRVGYEIVIVNNILIVGYITRTFS